MTKPQAHQLTAWLVYLLILVGYLSLAIWFPFAYVWATYEDMYGEWSQFYLDAAIMLLAAWLAWRPSPYRWFYLALALAFFYTAGEEISWGQRLLGFGSPEIFEEYNLQEETNLHNFLTGPVNSWTNDLMKYVVAAGLVGYGLAYPLLLRFRWGLATWFRRLGLLEPSLSLWPFFVTAALFELGLFHFNEAEIAEILVGTAMTFMVAAHIYAYRAGTVEERLNPRQSRGLATVQIVLVASVIVVASITTQILLHVPAQRALIDKRLLNGYEKFGKRYEELALWNRAAEFYTRSYAGQPERRDLLESVARTWQAAGDDVRYRKYAEELMDRTLTAEQKSSGNVAQQLSLVNSYREVGDDAQASEHLQQARQLAAEQAVQQPSDPEAAYTLGMVYELMLDYGKAREHYDRARTLAPSDVKYRAASERVAGYLNKPR